MYDVYISSSWKNKNKVRSLANQIRNQTNLSVFDFTDEKCRTSKPANHYGIKDYKTTTPYLDHLLSDPKYKNAVSENKQQLDGCRFVILLLPCGLDATADWAYAVGKGKKTIVIGYPKDGDFAPTHLWADKIVEKTDEVIEWLNLNP